jgi:hypothetical protein
MKEPTEYLHQAVVIFMQRSQFLYISLLEVIIFWAKALVLLCCHKPRAKAQGNSFYLRYTKSMHYCDEPTL